MHEVVQERCVGPSRRPRHRFAAKERRRVPGERCNESVTLVKPAARQLQQPARHRRKVLGVACRLGLIGGGYTAEVGRGLAGEE